MRTRYSPINDRISNKSPLKNDNKTITDVHPGTGMPINIFFITKYAPKQKELQEAIIPIKVNSLSGRDE